MNYTVDQITRVLRTRPLYHGLSKIKVTETSGESIVLADSTTLAVSSVTELFQIANDDWEVLGEISTDIPQ
tara:strand:+ start:4372 stop:4584 length:213 start_codon:yes stop_codon:yes gene_type:complete